MIFKCKICGGALELDGALSVAVCTYCGTKQTLPKLDDARRAALYDRANHFRRNNDFDKAAGIYEAILNKDATDAEAYWSIVLCRYGIEYVEDPATHKRVPTVNRAQYTSIFDDEDYKAALRYADAAQREVYEAEAKTVNEIQRGILALSQKEEPFDVFLSCKETDASGRRTPDSVLAAEIYNELTAQGIRVFFARITLEDKLGSAYEPYIFAALHSAKVMVVVGTKPEHFNAVWVKNEWSRYLALIKAGEKKTVIPAFRDMDPYDLPDEFSHLQAQDMSKLGFLQDLVRGIKKILDADTPGASSPRETVVVAAPVAIEPLFRRAEMALSDGAFEQAAAFYEQILNQEPENADAYVGKLLAERRVKTRAELSACTVSFENSDAYKKAMRFGDDALKAELSDALRTVLSGIEKREKAAIYEKATVLFVRSKDLPSCTEAKRLFQSISGYRDADKCVSLCDEKIEKLKAEWEKLREEKRLAEEARRSRAKKAWKRVLIVLLSLLLVAAIAVPTCLYVFGVAIPNAKYEKALDLIEEKRYDEAEELLDEAWYYAVFKKTQDKLDRAYEALDAAKEADQAEEEARQAEEAAKAEAERALEEAKRAAEEAKAALDDKVENELAGLANTSCEKAIRSLLGAGVGMQVVYQCNGGALPSDPSATECEVRYSSDADFSALPVPTKEGYRFVNWSCEESDYREENTEVRLVLKANWTVASYTIRYYLDGGSASNPTAYGIEDESFSLTAPTRTGYSFLGWTGTGLSQPTETVTIEKGSTGARTFSAQWEPNRYTVTFDPAGGSSAVTSKTVTYGKTASFPTPTKDAYAFSGWYRGNEKISSGTWSTASDVTLTAKWTPVSYTITYDLGNVPASNGNRTSYTIETNAFSLGALSYKGCVFEGWYKDSDFTEPVTSIPKGTKGNFTLYAKWTIHTYAIEYDWNGGEEPESPILFFTALDLPLTLCRPTKEDCSFYYWALDELDGEPVKQITTCRNYRLVANYLPTGLKLTAVTGFIDFKNYRASAHYSGNATEIEIPKYHLMTNETFASPYIERVAFGSCPNLTSVSFSNEVLELSGLNTFADCLEYENGLYRGSRSNPYHSLVGRADPNLPLTTIHEGTVYIGETPFQNDYTLQSIVVPESVRYAPKNVFNGCYRLMEIYNLSSATFTNNDTDAVPRATYTSLDANRSFSYLVVDDFEFVCVSNGYYVLVRYLGNSPILTLPENVNGKSYYIGAAAFQNEDVIRVTIPQNVTAIRKNAFKDCSRLLEVYNYSSLTVSAGNETANGGVGLYAIAIHTSPVEPSVFVKQGDYYAYYDYAADTYILFAYAGNSTELVLPDNINGETYRIAKDVFKAKTDATRVTISAGVTQIDAGAFENCVHLEEAVFAVATGWKRNVDGSPDPFVYGSSDLADPETAATVLRELTSDLKPMVRTSEP